MECVVYVCSLSLCYSQFLCRILIWNSLLDKQMWRFGVWISKVARKPTLGLWNHANERTRPYSNSPGILFKFSRKGSAVEVNPNCLGLHAFGEDGLTSKNNCLSADRP